MTEEIWKPIPGFSGYLASSEGRIGRKCDGAILPHSTKTRYPMVSVVPDGDRRSRARTVHRLIAKAFFGESPLAVDHLDSNPYNPKLNNLEYVTNQENTRRIWARGRAENSRHLSREGRRKVTDDQVRELCAEANAPGSNLRILGEKYNLTRAAVWLIKHRKTWKHLWP